MQTNRGDTSPYDRAKTIAERAAWAWLASGRRGPRTRHHQPRLGPRPRVAEPTIPLRLNLRQETLGRFDPLPCRAFRLQRGRCARRRAPACPGDARDDARSCGAAFLLAPAISIGCPTWPRCSSMDSATRRRRFHFIPVPDFVARMAALFSIHDCSGPALRTGKRGRLRLVGEGQASVGLDTASDHRGRPRHCTKPSGKRPGPERATDPMTAEHPKVGMRTPAL